MRDIRIGRRTIGLDHPTYFVADIAANHDGDLDRAVNLIKLAAEAGADAAKFQNFTAETIVSDYGFRALRTQQSHQARWKKSVYEVYADASLPLDWTSMLKEACEVQGIEYFTAPYALELIDAVSPSVVAWKVGSGDITWHEAIKRMAEDGKPVLLATGASDLDEVRAAVEVVLQATSDLVLMQCNTNYTGASENFGYVNLRVLTTFAAEFPDAVLGLSDHTAGHATVLGAVALGARVIEKHFTDDRTREGPDHAFSMNPVEWREMVDRTRELEAALGDGVKRVEANEQETVVLQRRAIRARRSMQAGEVVKREDVVALRPCPRDALPPYEVDSIIGRSLSRDVPEGDCIRLGDVR